MPLLTPDLRAQLSPLYTVTGEPDPLATCKFILPGTGRAWYVLEFDGDDLFYGYVVGHVPEIGFFRREALERIQGPAGFRVQRDRMFIPTRLSVIRSWHEGL